jgi:hypothetical protein
MSIQFPDPLLSSARGLLTVLRIFIIAFAFACLTLIPIFIFGSDALARFYAEHTHGPVPSHFGLMGVMGLIYGVAGSVAMERFLALLTRITESVALGNPFQPENAGNLNRMGWLLLAFHLLGIPVLWIMRTLLKPGTNERPHLGFTLTDVLMILTLFVLARVFAVGAAMRADLEGTI